VFRWNSSASSPQFCCKIPRLAFRRPVPEKGHIIAASLQPPAIFPLIFPLEQGNDPFFEDGPIEGDRFAGNNLVGELALHQGFAGPPHSTTVLWVGGEFRDRFGQRIDVVRRYEHTGLAGSTRLTRSKRPAVAPIQPFAVLE
jgi:hypothetical protein